MKARVLFGVFGFIFVLLALYVFPPIVLEAVVAALCVIATCEVLGSTKLVHNRLELLLAMLVSLGLAVGHFTVLPLDLTDVMQGLVLVMLVGSFAIELKFHDSMKVSQVAWGFFGALLVPYLLLSLLRIFQMNYHHGPFIVLLPLLAAWGADTCALFAGMFFGKSGQCGRVLAGKCFGPLLPGGAVTVAQCPEESISIQPESTSFAKKFESVVCRGFCRPEKAVSSQFQAGHPECDCCGIMDTVPLKCIVGNQFFLFQPTCIAKRIKPDEENIAGKSRWTHIRGVSGADIAQREHLPA